MTIQRLQNYNVYREQKLTVVRNLNSESKSISNSDCLHFLSKGIQDFDFRGRSLGSRSNGNRIQIPNWHHSKRNVPRTNVIRTLHFVDLVGLRHHDGMVLEHDRVRVHATLQFNMDQQNGAIRKRYIKKLIKNSLKEKANNINNISSF